MRPYQATTTERTLKGATTGLPAIYHYLAPTATNRPKPDTVNDNRAPGKLSGVGGGSHPVGTAFASFFCHLREGGFVSLSLTLNPTPYPLPKPSLNILAKATAVLIIPALTSRNDGFLDGADHDQSLVLVAGVHCGGSRSSGGCLLRSACGGRSIALGLGVFLRGH